MVDTTSPLEWRPVVALPVSPPGNRAYLTQSAAGQPVYPYVVSLTGEKVPLSAPELDPRNALVSPPVGTKARAQRSAVEGDLKVVVSNPGLGGRLEVMSFGEINQTGTQLAILTGVGTPADSIIVVRPEHDAVAGYVNWNISGVRQIFDVQCIDFNKPYKLSSLHPGTALVDFGAEGVVVGLTNPGELLSIGIDATLVVWRGAASSYFIERYSDPSDGILGFTTLTASTTLTKAALNGVLYVDATSGANTPTLPFTNNLPDGTYARVVKSDASANAITVKALGSGATLATLSLKGDQVMMVILGGAWKAIWQTALPVAYVAPQRILWASGATFNPTNKLPGFFHQASTPAGTFDVSPSTLYEEYEWDNTGTGTVTLDGGSGASWVGRDAGTGQTISVPLNATVRWRRVGSGLFKIIGGKGTIS